MWVRQLSCVVVRVRLRRPHRKRGGRNNHLRVTGGLRGMGDSPPEGFEDFVVERGPALHRTAVLLTHQEQAAVNLVQVALAKPGGPGRGSTAIPRRTSGGSSSTSSPPPRHGGGTASSRPLSCPRGTGTATATMPSP